MWKGDGIEHGATGTVKALSRHIALIVIALTANDDGLAALLGSGAETRLPRAVTVGAWH
jgi:hypothetical protein